MSIKWGSFQTLTIDDYDFKVPEKVEKVLNDTKLIKEEIITPIPLKTSDIRNISHLDNVELRKELFSMTSKITDEQKQKDLRTRLTKINSFIKSNDYDIEKFYNELNKIQKEIELYL